MKKLGGGGSPAAPEPIAQGKPALASAFVVGASLQHFEFIVDSRVQRRHADNQSEAIQLGTPQRTQPL